MSWSCLDLRYSLNNIMDGWMDWCVSDNNISTSSVVCLLCFELTKMLPTPRVADACAQCDRVEW